MFGGTITIDDARNGGSEPGSWALAIAHTPSLRAQCDPQDYVNAARGPCVRPTRGDAGEVREECPPAHRASPAQPEASPDA